MKKAGAIIIAIVVLITGVLGVLCTEKIGRGQVGAVYSLKGGTSNEVLSEGWHLVSPTKKVTEYSIATEQLFMSKDDREGSEDNESFDATCKDGVLNVDLEMSYHFNAEDVPKIAKRYRGMSGEDIVNTLIKGKVKTYTNEVTSKFTVLEAYMDKKTEVNAALTRHLKEKLEPYGVNVESATITRAYPGKAVSKAITERSKKAQEVEAAKLEQEKQKVLMDTKKIKAEGEAKAEIAEAKGEAEANRIVSESLTDKLLKQQELKAREKHGWVTIQGSSVITDER